jgi:acyl-coenzyme A synthetase/AMP-(fatty) acid ligase
MAVQVGGINVFPGKVAEVLKEHPAVLDACVRLMRPDEGNRLKAFVVARAPDADLGALEQQLIGWTRDRLGAPERPLAFSFGAQLPAQANGKPADWII